MCYHHSYPLSFSIWSQVETLKRQDTSAQLREAKDRLTSSHDENGQLQDEVTEVRKREKELREQLAQVERQWRRRLEQVERESVCVWIKIVCCF